MGKAKLWLIAAALLLIIGIALFVAVMTANNWNFKSFGGADYETNTYEISEDFRNISIKTDTADITFLPSDDEKCKIICYEHKKIKHTVEAQDGTLIINEVNEQKWYDYININFGGPNISVYLPKTEYAALTIEESTGDIEIPKDFKFETVGIAVSTGDVKFLASAKETVIISASTGDINVAGMSAGKIDLSVSTGRITLSDASCADNVSIDVSTGKTYLTNIKCKNITSSGDTGDISLTNVIVNEKLSIKRSTGDVRLDGCDAGELFIETDTGDVSGSLLSEKIFITRTDTGRINVPDTTTGGKCEIKTDTGNIKIIIQD